MDERASVPASSSSSPRLSSKKEVGPRPLVVSPNEARHPKRRIVNDTAAPEVVQQVFGGVYAGQTRFPDEVEPS
jgi:hypothetical protein